MNTFMLPDLDQRCVFCRGVGEDRDGSCKDCDGYGYHLTDEGKKLVEFLQRRGVGFSMSPLAEDELTGSVEKD